jgi:branched-chain amino acid aminotransferase
MTIDAWAWCDGSVRPVGEVAIPPSDRTLLYGLGAFETVRLHGGRPFLFDRHVERLRRSLAAIGLAAPPALEQLPAGVVELAARADAPSSVCRVTVTGGSAPEVEGPARCASRTIALLRPAPAPEKRPVRVGLAPFVHDPRSPLAGVKTTSYLGRYLQRESAERAGRLDDVLLDLDGQVAEGTVSTLFGVRGGRIVTPPLSAGILAGVTRGVVLELAAQLAIPLDERPLPGAELGQLDECFLTGAGKLLVDVDVLDGRQLPAARPVSTALKAALVRRIAKTCGVAEAAVRL